MNSCLGKRQSRAVVNGDMDEELANELLDDMDYYNDKVKCRKIELMLPKLMKMVEKEMLSMGH